MEKAELDRLLEKYYDGLTTAGEESFLREFFRTGEVPAGYETETDIFSYYDEAAEIPELSPGFESRIVAQIVDSGKAGRSSVLKRKFFLYSGIAAGLLILTGTWFFIVNRDEPKDTFTDPRMAYAETVKILLDVSAKMNRGTSTLEPIGRMDEITVRSIEKVKASTERIGKNIDDINPLIESLGRSERRQ